MSIDDLRPRNDAEREASISRKEELIGEINSISEQIETLTMQKADYMEELNSILSEEEYETCG